MNAGGKTGRGETGARLAAPLHEWREAGDWMRNTLAVAAIGTLSLTFWWLGVPSTVAVGAFAGLSLTTAAYCYLKLGRDVFHPMVFPALHS